MKRRMVIEQIDDAMAEVWRKKTPPQRLQIADAMFRSARTMLDRAVRAAHPDWNDREIAREVSRRISHGAC